MPDFLGRLRALRHSDLQIYDIAHLIKLLHVLAMQYRRLKIPGGTYFFTVVTNGRKPIFASPVAISAYRKAVDLVQLRHPFSIEAEVILPDHLHAIWSLPAGDIEFSKRWMLIKSDVSRALSRNGASVWQNRFWEHLIRDDNDLATHISYIHFNPVNHGLVKAPRDWPHSSFHKAVARGDLPQDWGSDKIPKWPEALERRSE